MSSFQISNISSELLYAICKWNKVSSYLVGKTHCKTKDILSWRMLHFQIFREYLSHKGKSHCYYYYTWALQWWCLSAEFLPVAGWSGSQQTRSNGYNTLLARPCEGAIFGLKGKVQICHERGIGKSEGEFPKVQGNLVFPVSNPSYAVCHREDTVLKHGSPEEHGVMDCRQLLVLIWKTPFILHSAASG